MKIHLHYPHFKMEIEFSSGDMGIKSSFKNQIAMKESLLKCILTKKISLTKNLSNLNVKMN